ncbi:MAG: bifunctional glutamate N-acetyltransferase/amino-acid acetyltransferase ArgJ [Corynebacterium sp.]|nr:bifunctional glutamate N-acetyltransferase/amino-acid acetyltransferase ArgJ [Corynebacterium sp.]
MTTTSAQGFTAAAVTAGIKASGKPDMALVVNNGPHFASAGVFTRNQVKAAPVQLTQKYLGIGSTFRAVVLNAGNANACTGQKGMDDAITIAEHTARAIGVTTSEIAECSTGVIGEPMPMEKVIAAIPNLALELGSDEEHGLAAARAIMTTDTVHKVAAQRGDGGYVIGGMGKGVGMMSPSLATMLIVLTTDARIENDALQRALETAVTDTFNTVDIDGTTSTNDTVVILASGASDVRPDPEEFTRRLQAVCMDLALQQQADGEGVTKLVDVTVTGAQSHAEACVAARTIARDNLFKCAMFGEDPNWGRVLAAVGMADVAMDPENITVSFNRHVVCDHSTNTPDARAVDLSGKHIVVHVDLGAGGEGTGTIHTTDLSHAYVEINSAYTT